MNFVGDDFEVGACPPHTHSHLTPPPHTHSHKDSHWHRHNNDDNNAMDVDPPPPDQLAIEPHHQQPPLHSSSPQPHPKQQQQQQQQHKKKKQQQQQQSRKRFRPSNGQDTPPEPVIEYEIRDGLRHVKPYVYSFYARAKGRWWGRSILEVFQKVIGHHCRMVVPSYAFLSILCVLESNRGLPSFSAPHTHLCLPPSLPLYRNFVPTTLSTTQAASKPAPSQ